MKPMDLMDALGELPDAFLAEKLFSEPPRRRNNLFLLRTALSITSAAACLLLTVGLAVQVWTKQQPIDTRPPQEPTAVLQTETTTKASTATAAQTTVPVTTQTAVTFETTAPVLEIIPTTEASRIPATTAPLLTTAAVTTPEQNAPTTLPQTTAAAVTTPPPHTTEVPQYQTAALTEAPTAAELPETTALPVVETLNGFRVEQYAGYQKIICTDEFPAPNGDLQPYTVLSDTFVLLSAADEDPGEPVRSYEVEHPASGKVYTVTQREYAEFALTVEEGELIDISLNRAHGFFHLQGETCSLYWFRDGEGFFLSGNAGELRELLEIARSFTPAGESK